MIVKSIYNIYSQKYSIEEIASGDKKMKYKLNMSA